MPRLEDVGLIGNGQFAAHVASDGDVVWCCLPRLDSDPILAALLDPGRGGCFLVGPGAGGVGRQHYLPNTNVLVTEFGDAKGAFRVIDFAPVQTGYIGNG